MRSTLAIPVLFASVLLPVAAGAAVWTYSGTVASVNDPGGFLGLSVNDPATGRFVWTTDMNQIFDQPTAAFYQELSSSRIPPLGVKLEVGGVAYAPVGSSNVTLQVHDDNTTFDDRFSLSDANVTNTGGLTYAASGLNVILLDEDRSVFSSTAIPASLPALGAFESVTVTLTLTNINGTSNSAGVTIDLTALEEKLPAVPVASPAGRVVLVLLLALGAVLARRARPGDRPAPIV